MSIFEKSATFILSQISEATQTYFQND